MLPYFWSGIQTDIMVCFALSSRYFNMTMLNHQRIFKKSQVQLLNSTLHHHVIKVHLKESLGHTHPVTVMHPTELIEDFCLSEKKIIVEKKINSFVWN